MATIREFVDKIESRAKKVPKELQRIATEGTAEAVRVATVLTPPTDFTPEQVARGANTISGNLKGRWREDSVIEAVLIDGDYVTLLANTADYASYVNDGHRVDYHFVPGLYVDDFGLLAMGDYSEVGGMYVGTQTQYVQGIFMKEQAKAAYQEFVQKELLELVRELFK